MEKGYQNPIPANRSAKTAKTAKKKKSKAFGKIRNFLRKMMVMGALATTDEDPRVIKALIPKSWFTKKGPGRDRAALRAYACMTPEQREIAIIKGWLPKHFSRVSPHRLKQLAA